MALLEVRDLRIEFATPQGPAVILDGVDLSLERGHSLGLVGESGCGKSMTALAIMGLLSGQACVSGTIALDGEDLLALPEPALCRLRGRRISMIFQEPMTALNPVKTLGQQVAEGLRHHLRLGRMEAEARAARLLDRVGLPSQRFPLSLYPHQLSGGQRQRVMIAAAMACGPDLLIADEPTTALDVTTQAQVLDLIAELVESEDLALLLITHDLGVVAEMADTVAVMYSGRIVEAGPATAVFREMAHPYTRGLFAAIPKGPSDGASADRLATIPGQVPDPAGRSQGCAFAPRCGQARDLCATEPPVESLSAGHWVRCRYPQRDTATA
ncbi:MAG: ABC transporter ATP-binding protein [Rhodospirillales bacterium]|nr:ABC transporter ATP-binding protein [Rhodospirillales bacterium]